MPPGTRAASVKIGASESSVPIVATGYRCASRNGGNVMTTAFCCTEITRIGRHSVAVRNFTRVDRTIWPRADDVRVHGERAYAVVHGGIAAPRSHSDETYDRRLP